MHPRPARLVAVGTFVLLVLAVCETTRAASPPASAAFRGLRVADSDAAADQDEARRITDCARWQTLTPDQVEAFLRAGGRRLSCPLPIDSIADKYKTPSEKDRQAIADAARDAKLKQWENRKNPTPAQIQALAQASTAHVALDKAKAAAADAEAKYNALLAANNAANDVDTAALQQQLKDLQAKQSAVTSAQQSYNSAIDSLGNVNAAKQLDAQQAQLDAEARNVITSQRSEIEKQMEADAKAHAAMLEEFKVMAAKREKDLAQAELDRQQAELDKQLADDALRKQHAAERQQRELERQQHAAEAEAQQKQFALDEEARLTREREAKATAAKNDALEAEIKKREEARATRDEEIAAAKAKAREAETEFQRQKDEQAATQKKYDELNKVRQQEENDRLAAEDKAKADKDKADADAQQKEEDVPEEERPKRPDEEECTPSPVGMPPKCEGAGRCFQVKGKPETQRCSCGKGYKGDRCEHEPCPPPAKEGNMVNGKCVKWESQYVCPGFNKIWDIKTTCYEINTKTGVKKSTRETNCRGIKEPENELYNRMCKFLIDGKNLEDSKGSGNSSNWDNATEDDGGDSGGGDSPSSSTRHRRLNPTPAPPAPARYAFVRGISRNGIDVPDDALVYSVYEHQLVTRPASTLRDVTREQCIASCYNRMGQATIPANHMRGEYCTWLLWFPGYKRGITEFKSQCRMFNSGTFPVEPQNANPSPTTPASQAQPRVLRNHAATGMLAFVTYPRVFDMFRPTGGGTTRTIEVLNTGDTFVATFSAARQAREGQGTFVTRGTPRLPNCLVAYETRLEAGLVYHRRIRTTANAATNVLAAFPPLQIRSGIVHVAANVPVGGTTWTYSFDDLLRPLTVVPQPGSITQANIGDRTTDSPDDFQSRFNEIMRSSLFAAADAGHLVAASQKPPNWFFNYVPQNPESNSRGCWYRTEEAARSLLQLGCETTYNVRNTYRPTSAGGGSLMACNAHFRPTKMSLDLRITAGVGRCETMAAEWQGQSLVSYDAATNELSTTRLMAHTLHRAGYAAASNHLKGLLYFATTSAVVNQCDAETGVIHPFASLKLTPNFVGAKLLMGSASSCLTSRVKAVPTATGVDDEYTLLDIDPTEPCKRWTTGEDTTHDDLKDDGGLCLTMVQVPTVGVVATLTDAMNGGCLLFIYEFDPFAAAPVAPAVHVPPLTGTISTTTPTAPLQLSVDTLLTGLVGTAGMNGDMEECLVWDAAIQAFKLTDVQTQGTLTHAACMRVKVSHSE